MVPLKMAVLLNLMIKHYNCTLILLSFQDKYHLRLKVLEEGLKMSNGTNRTNVEARSVSNGPSRRQSLGGAENVSKLSPNCLLTKRTTSSQSRFSLSSGTSTVLKHAKGTSKSFDGGTRSLDRSKILANGTGHSLNKSTDGTRDCQTRSNWKENLDEKPNEFSNVDSDDTVSGMFYDMLQKEVITLRKACHEKDQSLKDKDDAIEVDYFSGFFFSDLQLNVSKLSNFGFQPAEIQILAKKVDTLTKVMEVEAKKMRREVAAMEKEVAAMRVEKEQDNRAKRHGSSKAPALTSQLSHGR